ncbi:MAG: DNA-directed RNA polymerase subunit beta, partial [Clostridia bacterium]|nr:DNA-directed RNA polymerase subunit beta [Clostridia bacterium]
IVGRVKTYESIVKGNNISEPGIPEAFKVLLKELQSLALDVKVLTESGEELVIRELDDDDETVPTARARELEEQEAKLPEEEFEIIRHSDEEELDLEPMSIFDTDDEDDFAGKALFGSDEDDEDDDLGDKFTLFDSEEEESLDLFDDEDDGKDEE